MNLHFKNKWLYLGTVAACGLALAAGRAFHVQSTVPLRQQEAEIRQEVADLSGRIETAHATIAELDAREKITVSIRNEGERLQADCPAGSPMVWVPALVKAHFERSGIAGLLTRLNTIQDEPGLPGCERGFWSTALPVGEADHNIVAIIQRVADFEQQNPGVRILDFAICPDPEKPGGQVAWLNLTALIPK